MTAAKTNENKDKAADKPAKDQTEKATTTPPAGGEQTGGEQTGDTKPAKPAKAAKTKGSADTVALPAGKGTQNTESKGGPAPIPRSDGKDQDPGVTEGQEDTLRRQADKARWVYGQNETDTATLLAEQREIDKSERERGR